MTNGLKVKVQKDSAHICYNEDCPNNFNCFCEHRGVSKAKYCKDWVGADITQ